MLIVSLSESLLIEFFDRFGRVADDHCAVVHILGDDRTCPYDSISPHPDPWHDLRPGTYPGALADLCQRGDEVRYEALGRAIEEVVRKPARAR
jgi:hypothetical protein